MTQYFLDSSGLAKRYVEESGTASIRAITSRDVVNDVFVARIAPVEIVSSVMRRAREGSLSEQSARETRLLVDLDTAREYQVVALTWEVVRRAEDLLERHALRASDAIQLASALESSERFIEGSLLFVAADTRLLAAAAGEGLTTIDPNTRN